MTKVLMLSLLAAATVGTGSVHAQQRDDEPLLTCYESDADPHGERGYHRIEITRDAGRLIGAVILDDGRRERLLKRTGVIVRRAGHGFDTAYVGRQLKLLLTGSGLEGLLEFRAADRSWEILVHCQPLPGSID